MMEEWREVRIMFSTSLPYDDTIEGPRPESDKRDEEFEKMRDYLEVAAQSCLIPGWSFKMKEG